MTTNVGTFDRIARLLLGLVITYLAVFGDPQSFAEPLVRYGVGVVGIVLLVTAILKTCPLYDAIGIKTCRAC